MDAKGHRAKAAAAETREGLATRESQVSDRKAT